MILELSDIKPLVPLLLKELREEVEQDKFLVYPKAIQEYLGISYSRVNRLWNDKDFPRVEGKLKGVYLSELKRYLKAV